MALHFSLAELAARRRAACTALAARGLDGLLMFRQESMYYLTGYDSFGYVYFQCLYLGADGRLMLLTRAPDRLQARHTSMIEDIRIWADRDGADPILDLKAILTDFGLTGKTLGAEFNAYGLPYALGKRLVETLEGTVRLREASDLVTQLRLIKSPAELAYVRRAAELADAALDAAHATIAPGAFEGDILAAMHGAIYRGGGDDPANEFILGSGRDALLCRYFSGRKHLGDEDQITLEFAGVYRHYHSCLMQTVPVGRIADRHRRLYEVAMAALAACRTALKPGEPAGGVFDAYARVCDAAGERAHRLNACGYSLGTTFAPNWMDWPMFYTGNPVLLQPGMVFFLHMILMDSEAGIAMCPGLTVEVTETGNQPLTRHSLALIHR